MTLLPSEWQQIAERDQNRGAGSAWVSEGRLEALAWGQDAAEIVAQSAAGRSSGRRSRSKETEGKSTSVWSDHIAYQVSMPLLLQESLTMQREARSAPGARYCAQTQDVATSV